MGVFSEKGILVTGAGRGIGKRLAIGFASVGARVGLLARSKTELDLASLEIEHAGGVALRLRADVRDYEQVMAMVDKMRVQFGAIHVLICAAGIQGPIGPLASTPPKEWAETIQTNLVGVMNACRAVLPHFIAQRSGKIVILTGHGAEGSRPMFSAYAAAQSALVRFAETVAIEVRDSNIQVNCMNPGPTYTSMTDEILSAAEVAGAEEVELARKVRANGGVPPDKQIQLAHFLASERSNHISGKMFSITDDWKKLENSNLNPEIYTLRRLVRV